VGEDFLHSYQVGWSAGDQLRELLQLAREPVPDSLLALAAGRSKFSRFHVMTENMLATSPAAGWRLL
jgi:hypothetical protein